MKEFEVCIGDYFTFLMRSRNLLNLLEQCHQRLRKKGLSLAEIEAYSAETTIWEGNRCVYSKWFGDMQKEENN